MVGMMIDCRALHLSFKPDKSVCASFLTQDNVASCKPPTESVEGIENGVWTAPPKVVELHLPHIGVCAVQLSTEILVLKSKICQRGTFASPHSI